MQALRTTVLLLLAGHIGDAATTCSDPTTRPEWRTLSESQRIDYLDAVLCLRTKPSRIGLNTTLFEDFCYVHAQQNTEIHSYSPFLPWHRYFFSIYEQALRNDCSYTGPMPYWNWTEDSDDPASSPIWNATAGFGGNGNGTGYQNPSRPSPMNRCVVDGPFALLPLTYLKTEVSPHCLNRAWNDGPSSSGAGRMLGAQYSPEAMAKVNANEDYVGFWQALEDGPHGNVHQGISGDMLPSTSPCDPIFMVHHGNIDRLWWNWQQQDSSRATLYGGQNFDGTNGTLNDTLPSYMGMAPDVQVKDVMSTTAGGFCYTYI